MIIVGHRGARNEAPENTLAGFQHLRALGIHYVELDVRLSVDEHLVVVHDSTVNRTTNGKGAVRELTALDMQQLDASMQFPATEQTHIPTLEQVVDHWPELTYIQLEVKSADLTTLKLLTKKLAQFVEAKNLQQIAVVTSSDRKVLALMHKIAPHIHRGFVAERFTRNPIDVCLNHHCSHLVVNHYRCNESLIQQAQQLGLIVSVWTVNQINIAEKMQRWGADSIITDSPSLMIEHF